MIEIIKLIMMGMLLYEMGTIIEILQTFQK